MDVPGSVIITAQNKELKPPSLLLLALEGRAPLEFGAALLAFPLLKNVPRGDGHPVLVLPGLMAGDALTLFLRKFLQGSGYTACAWEQGLNRGPRDGVLDACIARVKSSVISMIEKSA